MRFGPPLDLADPDIVSALPPGARRDKVLVIGIDGLRWDRLQHADAPRLGALMTGGLFAPSLLEVGSGAETVSGPGWSTMATGVWPDKHGVRDNSFTGADYGAHPDFLTLLKQTDPALSTFAALDWPPLAEQGTFGPAIDLLLVADGEEHGYYTEDARIAGAATAVLRHQDPDATFIYLGCVDMVGHGCGALSTEYTEAIGRVDGWVGDLTDAVASRPGYADERWLILVTTDHGHLDEGGHGGYTDTERRTFILAIGTDVSPGLHLDGRLVDVAATVLHHFGLEIPVRLDGRSLLPGSLPRQQAAR